MRYLASMMDDDGRGRDARHEDELDDLSQRLDALRAKSLGADLPSEADLKAAAEANRPRAEMPEVPEWEFTRPDIPGQQKMDASGYMGLGVGLSVAYTLVGMAIAGWGIGWLIDRGSDTAIAQGIGTLIGATIGLAAGIFTIIKAQSKDKGG